MGWRVPLLVFFKDDFGFRLPTKVDMLLKKKEKVFKIRFIHKYIRYVFIGEDKNIFFPISFINATKNLMGHNW